MKMLISAALAAGVLASAPAQAVTFTEIGATTEGSPTFNRTQAGNPPTTLSGVATAAKYALLSFSVDAAGSYAFLLNSTTAGYDPFLALYRGSFNPSAALTNVVIANDDFTTGNLTQSGFTTSLAIGTTYIAVVSGFNNLDFGSYALTITGPGNVTPSAAAVPEPAAWAMMILGIGAIGAEMRRRKVKTTVKFARASAPPLWAM